MANAVCWLLAVDCRMSSVMLNQPWGLKEHYSQSHVALHSGAGASGREKEVERRGLLGKHGSADGHLCKFSGGSPQGACQLIHIATVDMHALPIV